MVFPRSLPIKNVIFSKAVRMAMTRTQHGSMIGAQMDREKRALRCTYQK